MLFFITTEIKKGTVDRKTY